MKRVRVIKLGGSLLTMPQLREKFHRWCRENPHPLTLVIVGGGGFVDAVRAIDKANSLAEDFAHWVCIDLMRHTARLAHRILGDVELYETMDELQQPFSGSKKDVTTPIIAVVQVGICFAREYPNMGLPESWDVTSDALAAAFGSMHAAEELVIMKSIDVPIGDEPIGDEQLEDLAAAGIVDSYFPELACEFNVRFVNLRTF